MLIGAVALWVTGQFWRFVSSEAARNYAETLAILAGGVWALYTFVLRRESKPALDIALN